MKEKIVIWGASGHARVVADILDLLEHEVVGYLDDVAPGRKGEIFAGLPILGGREALPALRAEGVVQVALGFGHCAGRLRVAAYLRGEGFELARAIHPRAVVAKGVVVGRGTVIAAGVVVNSATTIGDAAIINTSASVDHDCAVEDGAFIGPGAHLAGGVKIGRGAWVGIGSVIKEKITVGANAVLGAGSVVVADVPEDVLAYGVPARVIRKMSSHG